MEYPMQVLEIHSPWIEEGEDDGVEATVQFSTPGNPGVDLSTVLDSVSMSCS